LSIFERLCVTKNMYHLVAISYSGDQAEVMALSKCRLLIAAGKELKKKYPEIQYVIKNKLGQFVWPRHPKAQ
jgi:hypothetical protein